MASEGDDEQEHENNEELRTVPSEPAHATSAEELPVGPATWTSRVPPEVACLGQDAAYRFIEFFAATIRNANTRAGYIRDVSRFFRWLPIHGVENIRQIRSVHIAAYVEHLGTVLSPPSVKRHLAAIRRLFDHLATRGVIEFNPATVVKGPRYSVTKGKTPVLSSEEARHLLDSIPLTKTNKKTGVTTMDLAGIRDRALIATMIYSFARISAALGMCGEDYFQQGRRMWLRLHEKGGKRHDVPCHHNAEVYIDEWLAAAPLRDRKENIYRVVRHGTVSQSLLTRHAALQLVKRRARAAALSTTTCNHSFRATGITAYLLNGGTLENAQQIAAHADSRVTKLYDRTRDDITLDEIEKIQI